MLDIIIHHEATVLPVTYRLLTVTEKSTSGRKLTVHVMGNSKQQQQHQHVSGLDREISACCWYLRRNAVMKALLLVITALFVCVLGYYSSRITIAATVKAGSDTSSRSHGWKQQTEKEGGSHEGSDHHHPTAAFNATTPPLRLWSSDFHISPIADIKDLLGDSAIVVDKSLSGHCHLTDTCERDLRVITKMNGITILSCCASDNLYLQLLLLLVLVLESRSASCCKLTLSFSLNVMS